MIPSYLLKLRKPGPRFVIPLLAGPLILYAVTCLGCGGAAICMVVEETMLSVPYLIASSHSLGLEARVLRASYACEDMWLKQLRHRTGGDCWYNM